MLGSFKNADDDQYTGEWRNNKFHGQGVYIHYHGDIYIGEYKNGKRLGQGTYIFGPNSKWAGDKYNGEVKGTNFHGKGTYRMLKEISSPVSGKIITRMGGVFLPLQTEILMKVTSYKVNSKDMEHTGFLMD